MFFRLIILSSVLTCLSPLAWAETFIRDYTYRASDTDSKVTARANALGQLKAIVLQEVGTSIKHVITASRSNTGERSEKEFLEAMTFGVSSTSILQERWNGETYYVKARIVVDTQHVLEQLDQAIENRERQSHQLQQISRQQQELDSLKRDVAFLKRTMDESRSALKTSSSQSTNPSNKDVLSLASLLPLLQEHRNSERSAEPENAEGQQMMGLFKHLPIAGSSPGSTGDAGKKSVSTMKCLIVSNSRDDIAVVKMLAPESIKPVRSWYLSAGSHERITRVKNQWIESDWKVQLAKPAHRPVPLFSVSQWLQDEKCWKLDVARLHRFVERHHYQY